LSAIAGLSCYFWHKVFTGQPFRTMFYVGMHFCDFIVGVLLFSVGYVHVYSLFLSVSLPDLANKDVQLNSGAYSAGV